MIYFSKNCFYRYSLNAHTHNLIGGRAVYKSFKNLSHVGTCPGLSGTSPRLSSRRYHSSVGVYGFTPNICKDLYINEEDSSKSSLIDGNFMRWIEAYRRYGHFAADVNPLEQVKLSLPELSSSTYHLQVDDEYLVDGAICGAEERMKVSDVELLLKKLYCGAISVEFMHLPTLAERNWFLKNFENLSSEYLTKDEKIEVASDLLKSQAWDNFLAKECSSVKNYSGEGAESLIPFCREILRCLAGDGVEDVVIGMAHRGRLNLVTGLLEVPPAFLFRKMSGKSEFSEGEGITGDTIYHLLSSVNVSFGESSVHVTMCANPAHLEAITPIAAGKTRAKQRDWEEGHYRRKSSTSKPGEKAVCFQIHGDGAISGQGILQETLALSAVPHFDIGGTLHLVINNQVAVSTPGSRGRSGPYVTDIAHFCKNPVIHVNGDDPEAVVRSARLAVAYQRRFRRDVFVDLLCWRRWGHNEFDIPRLSNPKMYTVIDEHRGVPSLYGDRLVAEGVFTEERMKNIEDSYNTQLLEQYKDSINYIPKASYLQGKWKGMDEAPESIESWETGVDTDVLKYVGEKSVQVPEGFVVHPNIQRTHITNRLKSLSEGEGIDWATAEALAMGSLIKQGYNVRICGQDVGRGTFSQRHCMLVDQGSDEMYIPFNNILESQKGHLEVANSILSEEAVLGFEYGLSVENPNTLCIWEAQFGDFYNGAQIVIDTFVSSGEMKWMRQSGLTMILPHGYDGAGPEHSSCHFERFLQICDSKEDRPDSERVNWNIAFPTTPAQYFHLLRRQMIRNYRKPLVLIGPKVLLRLPAASSSIEEMGPNTRFMSVIGDQQVDPNSVTKLVFVTGKHYYSLSSERSAKQIDDTAIIRIESLCPFPTSEINEEIAKYKSARSFIWAQEEHRNMGAWFYVNPRFRNMCGTELTYVGRDVLGAAAVGIGKVHEAEAKMVVQKPFERENYPKRKKGSVDWQ